MSSTRRRFKLAKCLIEYRLDQGKQVKQKNCYGEYLAKEPLGAAKKAFKELATSLEIKNHKNLDKSVVFELVEITHGIRKIKTFIGSRSHFNPPKIKKIKMGNTTKDIPIKYEDKVYTIKPSRSIPNDVIRLDKEHRTSQRKSIVKKEATNRIESMMNDINQLDNRISQRINDNEK